MSSEMSELIRKEVEQWVGITRNRDIERSARVWMEGYGAALTYCADRISALLARTEAGADLRGGNVRFDVRLKNVEAGADGAVAWQCRLIAIDTGKIVEDWRECSKESFDIDGGNPRDGAYLRTEYRELFTHPQDASGDAVLTGPGDHDDLPAFLEWVAGEVVRRDTRAGNFAEGLAQSLRGRAHILRIVKNDAMQAKEAK